MAHYAFIDDSDIVTEVIVGIDETKTIEGKNPEDWYGEFRGQRCIRTSYNGNIRYNFASIGYIYDSIDDAFIAPMPECGHETLLLNDKKRWECADCEANAKAMQSRTTA
jgi:hypothetical protein